VLNFETNYETYDGASQVSTDRLGHGECRGTVLGAGEFFEGDDVDVRQQQQVLIELVRLTLFSGRKNVDGVVGSSGHGSVKKDVDESSLRRSNVGEEKAYERTKVMGK
jgi:hypothetical protein